MSDFMPGSPYFDEIPQGILTWPKLLKITIPIFCLIILGGFHFDVLLEVMIGLTLLLTILAVIRR
tara:strand:+ start:274 stop:468 length:195 start_codon:yes stop_codon:yes gene_type:complete